MRCGPAPWYGFRAGTEFMPLVSGWADFVHAYAAVLGQSITSEDADRVPGGKSNFLPGIFMAPNRHDKIPQFNWG